MESLVRLDTPQRHKVQASFVVNREPVEVAFPPNATLLELLREDLGLTGTKHGCELGECGTCTVLLDGAPVLSCLLLAFACRDRCIDTVEGMARGRELHPLQDTFAELGAAQCGYCTPGFLMTLAEYLETHEDPSEPEIREALSGNLCRCTDYSEIVRAALEAARDMRSQKRAEV